MPKRDEQFLSTKDMRAKMNAEHQAKNLYRHTNDNPPNNKTNRNNPVKKGNQPVKHSKEGLKVAFTDERLYAKGKRK